MLKIMRTEQGDYEPIITCDWCGQRITSAKDADYEWLVDDEGEPARTRIFFAHKQCSHTLDRTPGYAHWRDEELTELLLFLVDTLIEGKKRDGTTA